MATFRDLLVFRTYDFPEVIVSNPIVKSSGPVKHVTYSVKVKDHMGVIDCIKRYSDFDSFRDILV